MRNTAASQSGTSVIPVMRYRDLPAAIDWLCGAFGFERQRVTADSVGSIVFGQLTFGTAMIMVGPVRQSAFDSFLKQPDEIGGAETQVCYFFVPDVHAHCARAKAAGAEILFDIADHRNGGRSYSCRDPEGHLWNFGTYDPWRRQQLSRGQPSGDRSFLRRRMKLLALAAALLVAVAATIAGHGSSGNAIQSFFRGFHTSTLSDAEAASGQLNRERDAKEEAQRTAKKVQERLTQALSAKEAAENDANALRERLAKALSQLEAVELVAKADRDQLLKAWLGKAAAETAARSARRQLARERSARAQNATPQQDQSGLPRW